MVVVPDAVVVVPDVVVVVPDVYYVFKVYILKTQHLNNYNTIIYLLKQLKMSREGRITSVGRRQQKKRTG